MAIRRINLFSLPVLILVFFIFSSLTTWAHKLPADLKRVLAEIRRLDANRAVSGNGHSTEYSEAITFPSSTDAEGFTLNPNNTKKVKLKINRQGRAVLVIKTCVSGRKCRNNQTKRTIVSLPPEVGSKAQWVRINPENGHVYILDQRILHELKLPNMAGTAVLVSSYDLSQLELTSPIGLDDFCQESRSD